MSVLTGTNDDASHVRGIIKGQGAQPVTLAEWVQTGVADPEGNNDLATALETLDAARKRPRIKDLDTQPGVDDYAVGDIVSVNGQFQKLAITDEDNPNLFKFQVGHDEFNTTSGERWRGVSNGAHPNRFATDGEWTANPENAMGFLMASNQRRIRWGVKKSEYEADKGSAFASTDNLAIKITYPGSSTIDEAVAAYYGAYTHYDNGVEVSYLEFGHRQSEDDGNFNLLAAEDGADGVAEFFTVDGDGNATTTPFLTHVVATKHFVTFQTTKEKQLGQQVQTNLETIQSLKNTIQRDVEGVVGLADGAVLVTDIPDPDTSTETKVILTEDVSVTVGNKTEVKYGRGLYGLANKPEDAASNTKKWMSFIVGSGPTYRGFAEGFAGLTHDPLGDARSQYAFPPDVGNAVVSPLGDAIVSFREHRGLVSGYDVVILAVKKSVYYELLQNIHGSSFAADATPQVSDEHFDVRMVRTDTGATITNAGEQYWFSRQALASFGETVTIAGVDYYQLYYSGDTDFFAGIPDGTTCLLTLEHRGDPAKHTFDTTVAKAWSRLDRHDAITNELARLNAEALKSNTLRNLVLMTGTEFDALATKDSKTMYLVNRAASTLNNQRGDRQIFIGSVRWE